MCSELLPYLEGLSFPVISLSFPSFICVFYSTFWIIIVIDFGPSFWILLLIMDSDNCTAAATPTPAWNVCRCLWRGRIISFPHNIIFHALSISRGFWLCHGPRYAECADVSDELMTFLLSTNGALRVNCLIKKQNKRILFLIILLPWVLRFRLLLPLQTYCHQPVFYQFFF